MVVCKEPATWEHARADCTANGGSLVRPINEERAELLVDFVVPLVSSIISAFCTMEEALLLI